MIKLQKIIKTAFLFYQRHHHLLVCFSNSTKSILNKTNANGFGHKNNKKPQNLNNSQSFQLAIQFIQSKHTFNKIVNDFPNPTSFKTFCILLYHSL